MEKHYTLCILLVYGVAGIRLLKLDVLILLTTKCMNNQPRLNKKRCKVTHCVLANIRPHIITQYIYSGIGIFFKNQWEVVDSVLYTAGNCKMMVPAHNPCQSGIYQNLRPSIT